MKKVVHKESGIAYIVSVIHHQDIEKFSPGWIIIKDGVATNRIAPIDKSQRVNFVDTEKEAINISELHAKSLISAYIKGYEPLDFVNPE